MLRKRRQEGGRDGEGVNKGEEAISDHGRGDLYEELHHQETEDRSLKCLQKHNWSNIAPKIELALSAIEVYDVFKAKNKK